MVNLIVHQLEQTNPELLPPDANTIDSIRHANIPAEYKRDILETIWREAGLETLLSIGQGIREVRYDPIWRAIHSVSPTVALDKWRRFETFGHSRNRLRIDQADERHASFQRYTVDGGTPTTPENLLICGLTIAILEETGCRGLRCEMPLSDGTVYSIRKNGHFFVPDDTNALTTATWKIEWRSFSPRVESTTPETELPDIPLPRSCDSTLRAAIENMARLLMLDVTRQWKVSELAREAGLSTRSLQRRLHEAELSFSLLVRMVRIHVACRLLKNSDTSITTISFCTGFSDSAHFSRDFSASMGMTPSDYRAVWQSE